MFIVMPENNLSIKKLHFCCTKYDMIVLGFIDNVSYIYMMYAAQ